LVVHNNAKSNKLQDQVFWYKAEPHDEVKLGSRQFWEFGEREQNNEQVGGHDGQSSHKYVVNKNY
jgi:hypothetical protein